MNGRYKTVKRSQDNTCYELTNMRPLKANKISPFDVDSDAYRSWVRSRVQLARDYFKAGRRYMTQVENFRCRLAEYAYIARFEAVLDAIEREDYHLRADYRECKTLAAGVQMGWSTLWSAFNGKTLKLNRVH